MRVQASRQRRDLRTMRNPPSIFAVHAGQSDKHTLPSVEQLRLDSSRSFQHSGSMSAAKRSSSQLFKQDSSKRPKIGGSITSFFGGLKSGPPLTSAKGSATLAFNKDEWVATLTPEQRELLKLEIATLGADWIAVLKSRLVTKEFLELKRFLKREIESGVQVFPPAKDIYS
ncbi:uracil DNA glycosylase, partial [Ascosphaera aggregata]